MKNKNTGKRSQSVAFFDKQKRKFLTRLFITLLLIMQVMVIFDMAQPALAETYEEYYVGRVTGRCNVRQGAGADKEQLKHDNANVQLSVGMEVTIMGEEKVGSIPWYYIEFEWGEDKVKLTGYSTSTYIEKTSVTIAPTPTPTPDATPTPTAQPTPTAEAPSPTLSVTGTIQDDGDKPSSIKEYIIPIVVLVIGSVLVVGVIILRKVQSASDNREMTNAVKKIKNTNISNNPNNKNVGSKKKSKSGRSPVIKPSSKNLEYEEHSVIMPGTYVKSFDDEYEKPNIGEDLKEAVSRESEDKKKLRKEIDSLIEHDIVEHKYFGKGEVYDNSDVKLLEVRFGNDVRFLNKDSLVAKKLLKKSEEGNTRWS